jgi:two-component system LytT family response regulator
MRLRAYLVDDEELALKRLRRLLEEADSVDILGAATDAVRAQQEIELLAPDVLFLDIQMPELNGFDLLAGLDNPPLVVFTTAYDQYALKAFQANSIDYLLKPIDEAQLHRALAKLTRMAGASEPRPNLESVLKEISASLRQGAEPSLARIPSRLGERVHFIDLARVTHFFAEDKLTYAATPEKNWIVDKTIAELEQKLDVRRFLRVHRSTLVNLDFVDELLPWFGGRMVLKLRDAKKTEITVARDRIKDLKERLGL